MDSSNTGLPSVQRVSPVPVSLGPTMAAMSPAYTSSTSVRLAACISTSLLTRSRLPLVELYTYVPDLSVPLYTLKKASLPTKGSVTILKARAAKGSSSAHLSCISLVPSLLTPTGAGTSKGEGRKSTMALSRGCTPLLR